MSMLSHFPALLHKQRVGEQPITKLRTDIDRIFDDFATGFRFPAVFYGNKDGGILPSIEVQEDDKTVSISVELPGLQKDDIDVSVDEQVVTISGEKKQSFEKKEDDYFMSERAYGKFSRSLTLPFAVDGDSIDAKYDNGVLVLTIPKPPETEKQVKRVPVKCKQYCSRNWCQSQRIWIRDGQF